MPVSIYPFFSFSFEEKTPDAEKVYGIFIFKPLGAFDISKFSDFLTKELLGNPVVDQLIFAVPCVEADIVEKMKRDEILLNTLQRRKSASFQVMTYNGTGCLHHIEWLQGSGIDIALSKLTKAGLKAIEERNPSIIQKAPPNCIFKKTSGEKHQFFIRGSQLLGSDTQISFLSFSLLPHFDTKKHDFIYIDSMSVSPLVYKIITMKAFLCRNTEWQPQILSFHSYKGLDHVDNRPINPESTIVLISASSSGNMAQKVMEDWKVPASNVITMLSYKEAKESSILLHQIEEPESNKDDSLLPVEIRGEYFIPAYKNFRKFLIKHVHAPKQLKTMMSNLYSEDVFQAHKNKYAIWADSSLVVKNKSLLEWFDHTLNRRAPLQVSHVIYESESSEILADKTIQFYKDKNLTVHKLNASDILNSDNEFSSVIIVAGVVKSGGKLLSISRDLRNKVVGSDKSISYFIGLYLPESNAKKDILISSLTYSSARNFRHSFEVWFDAAIPNMFDNESVWQQELDFLKLDRFEEFDEIKNRVQVLSSGNGLTDTCFWSLDEKKPLKIQKDFVFWDSEFTLENATNNVNVFFTILCILQNARCLKEGKALRASEYESVCLDPECFARFNDGVIQASLLRGCTSSELNYALDCEASAFMKDMIVKMIQNIQSPMAEALLEFIISLALNRMKLVQRDLEEVRKTLKSSNVPNYLKALFEHEG